MKRRIPGWAGTSKPALNLWLLLASFLCLAACLVGVNLSYMAGMVNSRLANLCDVARAAYENGGPQELLSSIQRFEKGPGMRVYLLDSNGRDVATGQDRSTVLASARSRFWPFLLPPIEPLVVARTANYACIVVADPRGPGPGVMPMFWILPFLSILCATFAWYITQRMRRIEAAVVHFGSGKFGVRVAPDSSDPIGRLSRAFNEMADRIESLVETHRRLCIDISHELRSPLARLRLAVGLARSGSRGALDRIELEATRLEDLVGELLEVARAEVDPAALEMEPVDLEWLLREISDDCSIEANEKGCKLTLHFAAPSTVNGDMELLRRAIENVTRNAIGYSPPGASVELSAIGDLGSAVITIRDYGPGVPESALKDIFQPFYRVEQHRDRATGGVGLGLAIAERAIAVHHGSVKAENCSPGLRVEIRLPRERDLGSAANSPRILKRTS